jgi:hypothetical protein
MGNGVGAAAAAGKYGLAAANIVGHGLVGGAVNVAMGGKFQDGFFSAAAGAAARLIPFGNSDPIGGLIKASAAGGTASAIGGGKFANGAYMAAFQYLVSTQGMAAGKILAEDLYTGVRGILYDKMHIIYISLSETWQDSSKGILSKVGLSVLNTIPRLLVPTQGPGLGAGIGVDDHYSKEERKTLKYEGYLEHIDPSTPKTQNASWAHDFSYFERNDTTMVGPWKHVQWVIDTCSGPGVEPGVEPGVFGQIYRVAGTFAFPTIGGISRVTGIDL